MTDEELNQRFAQLTEAVSRVAEASTQGMDRLLTGQLALQRLGGQLSEVVLEIRAEVAQLKQENANLRQRQAETDARFNVLLEEIRFLIRRQFPEDGQS
ncbi:MAG: hypothetical protein Q6L60_02660 [Thermostichus sp. HHBFW_bins_43]